MALGALGLIPLLAAMWVLSGGLAWAVGAIAIGQLVVTGAMGRLSIPTVAAEGTAYLLLALVCRLYAEKIADLMMESDSANRSANGHRHGLPVGLAVRGRPAGRGLEVLTERERQVARLAAQGYTAREIGTALHIGRRTVETHLANAYDKLGIRSKRELVRAAPSLEASSPVPTALT